MNKFLYSSLVVILSSLASYAFSFEGIAIGFSSITTKSGKKSPKDPVFYCKEDGEVTSVKPVTLDDKYIPTRGIDDSGNVITIYGDGTTSTDFYKEISSRDKK